MSKYLKVLAPALAGTASVLALSWVLAGNAVPVGTANASSTQAAAASGTSEPAPAADTKPATKPETVAAAAEAPAPSRGGGYGLGRPALPEEVAAWDIDIRPDGTGLPEGSGDVWTGEEVFIAKCASCHGDFGEAVGRWPVLAGGQDTLDRKDPVKTIGSYWPYLSTVWDYVNRAMPFGDAQSLEPDEVYAITAYLLYLNNVVDDDFELSRSTFSEVTMPNEGGFKPDDRLETEFPAFTGEACMDGCKDSVEITMRAAVLDVTPETEGDGAEAAAAAEPAEAAAPAESAPETAAEEPAAAEEQAAAAETDTAAAPGPDPELVAAGERVFKKCAACHQVGENAKNRSGPHLNGVVSRAAAAVEGFRYSKAMEQAAADGLTWDRESLAAFLAKPRGYLKGTKMAFAGLKKEKDINAILAFLEAQEE